MNIEAPGFADVDGVTAEHRWDRIIDTLMGWLTSALSMA